jgi:hypothetical protein
VNLNLNATFLLDRGPDRRRDRSSPPASTDELGVLVEVKVQG